MINRNGEIVFNGKSVIRENLYKCIFIFFTEKENLKR